MLIMNVIYQHFTNDRKDEEIDFDECSQLKSRSKRTEKVNQNKCVSSQNKQYEKRRGRYGRRLSAILSPYLSSAGSFVVSSGRRAAFHGNLHTFSGKAPLTTTNVPTTKRRRFQTSDWLSKTDELNKDAEWVWESRLITQECKIWHKQLFIAYF